MNGLSDLKDIPGYEGLYKISSDGTVYGVKRKIIRKVSVDRDGYNYITLCKNNKYKGFRLHRLIMLTFMGPSDLEVNHKNGVKSDNRLNNLEYVTTRQNILHAKDLGLNLNIGENHGRSKLENKDIFLIRNFLSKIWSQSKIAKTLCISKSAVNSIINNKTWKHI